MSVAGNQYFTNVVNVAGQANNLNVSSVDAVNLNAIVAPNNSLKSLAIQTPIAAATATGTLTANTINPTLWDGDTEVLTLTLPAAIAGIRVVVGINAVAAAADDNLTINVAT